MLVSLPWIILSVLIYNAVVFLFGTPAPAEPTEVLGNVLFEIPMLSTAVWKFTVGDAIMLLTLIALFAEILKSTRTRPLAILDHGLSTVVFIICLIEFLMVPEATTSLFFFITLIALIDVVAGFSVGIRAARRDFSYAGGS